MNTYSISGLNQLSEPQRREITNRIIAPEILTRFNLSPFLVDQDGNDLLVLHAGIGSPTLELELFHRFDFPDPILYGHLTDTVNGQIHVLLYIMNDPDSPRFDVDRMPDGTPTKFGTIIRNKEAETAAMQYGLVPGQIRRGLHLLSNATNAFEAFIEEMGHTIYFVEPLYYHNAWTFERYGFSYQSGRRLMERIHAGFSPGGEFESKLDGSTFRPYEAARSVRLRSWAIHDGILGERFTNVTMYKKVKESFGICTTPGISW
jgi:hypothetical protein